MSQNNPIKIAEINPDLLFGSSNRLSKKRITNKIEKLLKKLNSIKKKK